MNPSKEPSLIKHVRTVTLDLDFQQLVHLLWERTTKRHTRTEKAPGKENKLLTHTVALLKHVKNVVQLETSTLTGHDFHDWANQYNKQIPIMGVTS